MNFVKSYAIPIIIALLILAAALVSYDLFLTPDVYAYPLKDNCGKFANLIQHTLNDPTECRISCTQQCETADAEYHDSFFTEAQEGCHTCDCYCKSS